MSEEKVLSASEQKKEDWMNAKWRPAMGWLYMLVCFCDFVIFPVLHAIYIAALYKGAVPPGVPPQWNPLTLQGAGLFHLAMGAVLGLAAYGRTQEKVAGANNGGLQLPSPTGGFGGMSSPAPSNFGSPAPSNFGSGGFSAPAPSNFGGSSFGSTPSPAPSFSNSGFGSGITTTASGKKIVPNDPQPEL